MNRFLYVALVTFITIACFSMYINRDIGSISIEFVDFSFQTNFLVFGAALLSSLFALLLIHRGYLILKSLYNYVFKQRAQRQHIKANSLLKQALIEYDEGRYDEAEKNSLSHVSHCDNPLLAYLTAARAAQHQGAPDRRDNYLRKALENSPDAEIAIGITQARLQLQQGQREQALATLQQLHGISPYHAFVLKLLADTYLQLEDWDALQELLPLLQKHSQLSAELLRHYEVSVCRGHLLTITGKGDSSALNTYWQEMPKHLVKIPELIEHYSRCLITLNETVLAEEKLRQFIDKEWHDSTIELYSELDLSVDNKTLEVLESWLNENQNNPYLLLSLGKACQNLALWGKSRNYFEASISVKALPESYLRLARLLEEKMDAPEAAAEYYRQGLHLLVGSNDEKNMVTSNSLLIDSPRLKIVN